MNTSQNMVPDLNQQEQSVDFKSLFFKFYNYWYFFIITIFVSLLIAFLFNKYTKPSYKVKTTVLIKDEKKGMIDPQSLMGLGSMANNQNLQNEIGVLKSRTLVTRTIKSLDFMVSYYEENNFVTTEIYKDAPFTVLMDTGHIQPSNLKFNIVLLANNEFSIFCEGEAVTLYNYTEFKKEGKGTNTVKINKKYKFGVPITGKNYSFKVILNFDFEPKKHLNKNYVFAFNEVESLVSEFIAYEIEPINKEASVVEISLKGGNVQKSVDFLNKLSEMYIQRGLDKKNQIATNTISFISTQLIEIGDSLTNTESKLQNFLTTNKVMDIDYQSQQVFEYMKELDKQKAELIVKSKYYNYLKEYLGKNQYNIDDLVVPSSMGIEDPVLNQIIGELSNLYNERSERLTTSKAGNPMIIQIDQKILNSKRSMAENINNIVNNS
ncbi:MAG: Wzz/FepE/Etk N-terminal domain-containing protein, partial [Bacteroidota bacterium]